MNELALQHLCLRMACLGYGLKRYIANGQLHADAARDFYLEFDVLEENAKDLPLPDPIDNWEEVRQSLYAQIDAARGLVAQQGFWPGGH